MLEFGCVSAMLLINYNVKHVSYIWKKLKIFELARELENARTIEETFMFSILIVKFLWIRKSKTYLEAVQLKVVINRVEQCASGRMFMLTHYINVCNVVVVGTNK